ncbi:MAG: hypothetical protein KC491_07590 [Dehalococcoidia bacterium]|nr:hypothetical protein [Dehalococcoidia bacterium]
MGNFTLLPRRPPYEGGQQRRYSIRALIISVGCPGGCGYGPLDVQLRLWIQLRELCKSANHGFDEFHSYDDAQSLVGLSENDIVGRFGLPTTEKWEPEWDAAYWMRPQGFCMDGWYLVLNYDDSREVVAAGVVAD